MPYANKEDELAWRIKWEEANKEKRKVWHKKSMQRPEYIEKDLQRHRVKRDTAKAVLLSEQSGLCAICKQGEKRRDNKSGVIRALAQDHDHLTGKLRGLLCSDCNLALGFFQDSIPRMEDAIAYLKKWLS